MTALTLPQTLTLQMGYTNFALHANTEGLTDELALKRTGDGSNMNWVIGHITASRQHMLSLLGIDPIWDEVLIKRYQRGSKPPQDSVPVADMIDIFICSGDMVRDALPQMTPEALAAAAPFSPVNNPEETVGSLLAGLMFHESYHIGQLGVLRRLAGLGGAIK